MTRGNVLLVLVIVFGVIIAWQRDVGHATRNAELDRRSDRLQAQVGVLRSALVRRAAESTRNVDTVYVEIVREIDTAIVAAQRLVDSLAVLQPMLALAVNAQDSIDLLLTRVELQTRQTIAQTKALERSEAARSLLFEEVQQWRAMAPQVLPVLDSAVVVLKAEQDARACRILDTVKFFCIPRTLQDAAKVVGGIVVWEHVVRPVLRISSP